MESNLTGNQLQLNEMPNTPPPSYQSVMAPQFRLSYLDFVPQQLSAGGVFSSPEYERFGILVGRANEYLRSNPTIRCNTCESLEVAMQYSNSSVIDSARSTYYEYGEASMYYVRVLRLWIEPKEPSDPPEPQQINFLNLIPACSDPGGIFSNPKFDSFDVTISKMNNLLRSQPLPGHIINIETQEFRFKTYGSGIDPDKCYWREPGKAPTHFLYCIRIFYQQGAPAFEEIGCIDFVPQCLKPGGVFSLSNYESFGANMQKAYNWIINQPELHLTNVQSIDYKLSQRWGGESLDTMRTLFRQSAEVSTHFIRIVRACYTRKFSGPPHVRNYPTALTYRTFVPCQVTTGGMFSYAKFEPLTATVQRAIAWLNATGARVIGAETVPIRSEMGSSYYDPESTYSVDRAKSGENILLVIRLFLDGVYQDPPAEVMPPAPQIIYSDTCEGCCTLL